MDLKKNNNNKKNIIICWKEVVIDVIFCIEYKKHSQTETKFTVTKSVYVIICRFAVSSDQKAKTFTNLFNSKTIKLDLLQ